MKNLLKLGALCVAMAGLTACGSDCTEETLRQKSVELMQKMQELSQSGDAAKIMALSGKMSKFQSLANAKPDNLEEACELMDELMAEL